jgi:hypothetical protein
MAITLERRLKNYRSVDLEFHTPRGVAAGATFHRLAGESEQAFRSRVEGEARPFVEALAKDTGFAQVRFFTPDRKREIW